jgi:hypothetical protein
MKWKLATLWTIGLPAAVFAVAGPKWHWFEVVLSTWSTILQLP